MVIRILRDLDNYKLFALKQGLLEFKELIYLLENLRKKFIKRIYEALMHGYAGVSKTTKKVARDYYFPSIRKVVKAVLRDYYICRISKLKKYKLYGFL